MATRAAQKLDAADGVLDGRYYGTPIVERRPYRGYVGGAAERLDAADGVIDGAYYGRPIVQRSYAPTYSSSVVPYGGRTYFDDSYPASYPAGYPAAYSGSAATALDAADGVLDGRYFGSRIVGAAPRAYGGRYYDDAAIYEGAAPTYSRYGAGYVRPASRVYAPRYSGVGAYSPAGAYSSGAALSLDAADGVIDGRYYGSRIVDGGARYAGYGGYGYSGVSSYGVPARTYGGGYYGTSAATSLDAADGVIDGRYFGRPIVEGSAGYRGGAYYGRPAGYSRTSAAVNLDAKDGVLDGKYFGSKIVA